MEKVVVPVDVAQHVLWHFGDSNLGLQPGSFVERLLTTLSAADQGNREKLFLVFPEYVYAFHCVQGEPWGLEWLRSKVKRAEVPDRELPVDLFEAAAVLAPALSECEEVVSQIRDVLDVLELAWSREIEPEFGPLQGLVSQLVGDRVGVRS